MTEQTEDQSKPGKAKAQPKASDEHLISMAKAGETIKVHPTCVADHKRLGWTEA